MKKAYTMFLLVLLFISCSNDDDDDSPSKDCYECKRVIQTKNADGVQILRQEDEFTLCDKTKEEILAYELKNTKTVETDNGGTQEFFTSFQSQK